MHVCHDGTARAGSHLNGSSFLRRNPTEQPAWGRIAQFDKISSIPSVNRVCAGAMAVMHSRRCEPSLKNVIANASASKIAMCESSGIHVWCSAAAEA
jgi:hypothetical protein